MVTSYKRLVTMRALSSETVVYRNLSAVFSSLRRMVFDLASTHEHDDSPRDAIYHRQSKVRSCTVRGTASQADQKAMNTSWSISEKWNEEGL